MSSAHGVVHVTADNGYSLYINGQQIGSGESWVDTDEYTFDAPCDQPTVYGIEGYDLGGIASVIMEATHCGEQVRTDTRWKCQHSREAPRTYCTNACRNGQDSATCKNLGNNYLRPGTNWGGEQACKAACDADPTCNIYMLGCGTTCGHPNQPSCLDEGQNFDCVLLTECTEERASSCGSYIQYKDPSQHGTGEESTAWLRADFDDSSWASAQDAGDNGVSPWYALPNLRYPVHSAMAHANSVPWYHAGVSGQGSVARPTGSGRTKTRITTLSSAGMCPTTLTSTARLRRLGTCATTPTSRSTPRSVRLTALSPLPLISSHKPEKSLCGADAFSHYNGVEGGKSEGRIWHSELCNTVRLRPSFSLWVGAHSSCA